MIRNATSGGAAATGWLRLRGLCALTCVTVLLVACTRQGTAPIEALSGFQTPHGRYWTVTRGDTLYSIAWVAGMDYRTLARWNGIAPPYRIGVGQRLRLSGPARPTGARPRYRRPAAPVRRRMPAPARERAPARAPVPSGPVAWAWPARGRVVRRFRPAAGSKGIDIAGGVGAPVRAAAAGRVVYAGSGLRGYGELIILKNNKDFLSAYAHNSRILVEEGDMVRRGQKIALMGSSGTDRVMLHFEIRLRGNPVDPLNYLPRTQ